MKAKIIVPLLTLACLLAVPATAQVNYAVSGGTAYVTSSPNASGDIVIASTYNGYPVTSIGNYAFSSCASLMSVTIPNSVTRIGGSAFYNCYNLTSVGIPNSVTNIGSSVFENCTNLTNVTIPNGVTSVGGSAFLNCTSLTNVTIPNSVTTIETAAFRNCTSLINVTIPNSVISIQVRAFSACTRLTSGTIPNSVTNIGSGAFSDCTSLTNISVDAANSAYTSLNGVLFNKAQTILIQFPGGRGGGYAIPNGVTGIRLFAFSGCTRLASVTIPNSVTSIGTDAFRACTSLTNVTMGNSVTTIGGFAFSDCTSLTSVTIPNSVMGIGFEAFLACSSLTNVSVDAANSVYSSLNGVLFNKAQTILFQFPGGRGGSYVIPNSVTSIWSYAFKACTRLASVTIPNSVTSIEVHAFYNCASLTNVTMGNGITSILDDAFRACTSLKNVTIPNSVNSISPYAFSSCTSLTSVTIPSGVTSIGDLVFSYCISLTNITVAAANPAYSSLNGVLFNKAQTTLIQFPCGRGGSYAFPNSVTSIEDQAFGRCISLTSVTLGNSLTSLYAPFSSCPSLTNITAATANPAYSSINGVLFNKGQTILMIFPAGRGGSYVIPSSVTTIELHAFVSCTSLTGVTFPNSVATIRDAAFYNCTSLANLTFLGNAPSLGGNSVFYNVGTEATVYYYYGRSGWGQTYGGLPAVMLGAPAPQVGTGTAGVTPGGFGFTLTGVVNQSIVVEASTDLANWQPVWTNTLSAASTNFVDPQWLNHPRRFYRTWSY